MLDVGTGSGVLAIAADRLGAARALGIDYDAGRDPVGAREPRLNPDVARRDLRDDRPARRAPLPPADVVTANLTGALLVRSAGALLGAVRPGGTLILSGIQSHERDEVRAGVCRRATVCWEREEDGWIGIAVKKS